MRTPFHFSALLILLGLFTSLPASMLAQAPASLGGTVFRYDWQSREVHAYDYGSTELHADNTFIDRFHSWSLDGLPFQYYAIRTGTFAYTISSAAVGTLTFNYPDGSHHTYSLGFTSPTEGNIVGFEVPSHRFFLSPLPAESANRALVNVSTLLVAKRGSPSSIGFIVGGSVPREVLVRIVGPSLSAVQVPGFASVPTYVISGVRFGLAGQIPYSSNWSSTPESTATLAAEAARVGAFPLVPGSADKADVVLLYPGAYSISVAPSAAAGEGATLVEAYEVP